MDKFRSYEVFVRTAEKLNFAAAARDLKLTRAMVSKHVADLEHHLGTRLFQRTTRRVSLTEAGRTLAARASTLMEAVGETEDAVRELHSELRGRLRVNTAVSFGAEFVAPLVARFLKEHPGVEIDLTLNDRTVDLVEEGYDLVIRIGRPLDSSLIARQLAPVRLLVVGAPAYFKAAGSPRVPADLRKHNCLGYAYWSLRNEWPLTPPGGRTERVRVQGSLVSNNGDALRLAAIQGLGLIMAPSFTVASDLRSGRLQEVLPGQAPSDLAVQALYAPGSAPTAKLRAFIDMLAKEWKGTPPWDRIARTR
jgi:DNA-binding transcriptional LysR family regulator